MHPILFIKKVLTWCGSFFNPTDKSTSMTRLGFFLLHIFVGYLIYNFVQICLMPPILINGILVDKSLVLNILFALIMSILGIAYGGKVWSKYAENKELTIQKQDEVAKPV